MLTIPKQSLKEWCAVSYFAAAFAREDGDWIGAELDLEEVETIEELADEAKDEFEGDTEFVVVLVEDENWFAVVRVAADGSAEMYVSDAAEAVQAPIGEVLVLDLGGVEADEESGEATGDGAGGDFTVPAAPVGEPGLLTDLGVKSGDLAALATGGLPPADAVTEIAERIGAVDALEDLR
jgi:putative tRNA adenosine deaminase-associated protein